MFASIIILIENGIIILVLVFFDLGQTLFATMISFTLVVAVFAMLLAREVPRAVT